MQEIQSFKDLIVWQKAIDVIADVYKITKSFPSEERFGLTSQMQCAAVSIAANIAEGHGRGTRSDYAHFLDMAHGSTAELETFFITVRKLAYCSLEECSKMETRLHEVGKMLRSLRNKLRIRPSHL